MKKEKVPELRFPEFDESFLNTTLGKISKFSKGKGVSKSDVSEDGTECIRYGELYTKYGELIDETVSNTNLNLDELVLSEEDDLIIPASGETAVDIATASCVKRKGIALGGDINIIKCDQDSTFLAYYLNGKKKTNIARYAQGSSVIHLYSTQLKLLKLNLPTKPEQQKIASFLSAVDTKIEQLTRKKELLEEYKKGVMQKLFPKAGEQHPELRFKDEHGEDFPDWEVKRLGRICEMTSSKRVYLSDYVEEGIPFYRGKEISELRMNQTPSDILYIKKDKYFEFKAKYGVPKKNDILVTAVGTLGNVFRIRNNDPFYFKDGNLIWFRKIKENSIFLEILLQWYNRILLKTSIGSTQKALTMVELRKLKFSFPSTLEQNKISEFLEELDQKIEFIDSRIGKTKTFKKGLLQKMFV